MVTDLGYTEYVPTGTHSLGQISGIASSLRLLTVTFSRHTHAIRNSNSNGSRLDTYKLLPSSRLMLVFV